jgi:hypothetical protein
MRHIALHGVAAGILTGTALGFGLKWVETTTAIKVYTLLLNVDFIPWIPQPLSEWVEFALHLIVSIGIAAAYVALMLRYPAIRRNALLAGVAAGAIAIPTFIPLTLLSDRTPDICDTAALSWWVLGHLVYGVLLGLYGHIAFRSTAIR